ncbi:MAG TPA: hypothetical protein VIL48_11575 [Acidimicrobiales bacterium]
MVTFLVARVLAAPAGTAAELVPGPASTLLRRQLGVLADAAQAVADAARTAAAHVDPGLARTLAGLAAVVLAAFLVGAVAALNPPRPRPVSRRPAAGALAA